MNIPSDAYSTLKTSGLKIERGAKVAGKKIEIIIETERVLHISSRSKSIIFWCEACARSVPALTLNETALVFRVSEDEILRKLEDRQLHLIEACARPLRICSSSLLK